MEKIPDFTEICFKWGRRGEGKGIEEKKKTIKLITTEVG